MRKRIQEKHLRRSRLSNIFSQPSNHRNTVNTGHSNKKRRRQFEKSPGKKSTR